MDIPGVKLTPTQTRIMRLLADGLPHHGKTEIKPLLPDGELAGPTAVRFHMSKLREKLVGRGETIICEIHNNRICYRYVILVSAPAQVPGK